MTITHSATMCQVKFEEEDGIDCGGVSCAFFNLILKTFSEGSKTLEIYNDSQLVWFKPDVSYALRNWLLFHCHWILWCFAIVKIFVWGLYWVKVFSWQKICPGTSESLYLGMIFGMALYNHHTVTSTFPQALFKKLLGLKPTLKDLEELSPCQAR